MCCIIFIFILFLFFLIEFESVSVLNCFSVSLLVLIVIRCLSFLISRRTRLKNNAWCLFRKARSHHFQLSPRTSTIRIERIDTLQQVLVVTQKHDLCSNGRINCARVLANHTTKSRPYPFRRSRSGRDGEKPTSEESEAWKFRLQCLPLNFGL